MEIAQSFILVEGETPYSKKRRKKFKYDPKLNFYSYLLSYLTIRERYGPIKMYCNQYAYDEFMKYIPYDEFHIIESINKSNFDKFWSIDKVNVLSKLNPPYIHIDGDVIIMNDELLKPFINGEHDIICQNFEDTKVTIHYNVYTKKFNSLLESTQILGEDFENSTPVNCGVIGVSTKEINDEIVKRSKNLYEIIKKNHTKDVDGSFPIYLEQYVIGTVINDNKLDVYEVLDSDLINKIGIFELGNKVKYTHLWGNSKFKYISYLKNSVKVRYPEYYNYIEKFEKNIK